MKTICMIPARMGSQRLKKKNLLNLNGQPMISYSIEAAKKSNVFDKVVINSEDSEFLKIAEQYSVEFYKRPLELGSSQTKSDEVVYDFMKKYPSDITVWVNSVSPLQRCEDIQEVVNYFKNNKFDSLITTVSEQVHCLYENMPVNFNFEEKFAQTQELKPVKRFVYSIMAWRNESFIKSFEEKGVALMNGNFATYDVDKLSGFTIKTQRDFDICEIFIKGLSQK